jgi:hypothetical protein
VQLGDLNKWKFIHLVKDPKQSVDAEIEECYEDALEGVEATMLDRIKPNHYGAVNTDPNPESPEGYWIVRWTGEPEVLQDPAMVEGCDKGPMEAGTVVCQGEYMYRVPGAPRWHQSLRSAKEDRTLRLEEKKLFRVQYVLDPDIDMEAHRKRTAARRIPKGCLTEYQLQMADAWCKRVPLEAHEDILQEKERRAAFDIIECTWDAEEEEQAPPGSDEEYLEE